MNVDISSFLSVCSALGSLVLVTIILFDRWKKEKKRVEERKKKYAELQNRVHKLEVGVLAILEYLIGGKTKEEVGKTILKLLHENNGDNESMLDRFSLQ